MKTSQSELREFLRNIDSTDSVTDSTQPTMADFIAANSSWDHKDIVHYLRTEQDPVRLARWCELYLQQDY